MSPGHSPASAGSVGHLTPSTLASYPVCLPRYLGVPTFAVLLTCLPAARLQCRGHPQTPPHTAGQALQLASGSGFIPSFECPSDIHPPRKPGAEPVSHSCPQASPPASRFLRFDAPVGIDPSGSLSHTP